MEKQGNTAKKTKLSTTWKALTILISLLIIYTVYHVCYGLTESVATTPAGLVEQSSSVVLEGVIFRNEEGISTKYDGDMLSYLYNGERATVGAVAATIYSKKVNEDINAQIEELEGKLDVLKKSNVKGLVSIVDIEKLRAEIDQIYTTIMLASANGDNYKVQRAEKELLICLNKLKIYEGKVSSYNDDIALIEAQLDSLYKSFKGETELVIAEKGGYFYHSCDGYEDILTSDFLASASVSSISDMIVTVKNEPVKKSGYKCKFVYDNVWRMATVCDEETASLLTAGKKYGATLFDVKERRIDLVLESIGEVENGYCVLVFTCSNMPEDFDYTRYQSFKLDISSIEGYRVPKDALVTVKDKNSGEEKVGVYTINASVVYFKRVDIIGESEGYYIAAKLDKSKENYQEYLALNDLIVLDVDGMYDGKVLLK